MARARSPNSIEAEEMYKNGMKLVDIAKQKRLRPIRQQVKMQLKSTIT